MMPTDPADFPDRPDLDPALGIAVAILMGAILYAAGFVLLRSLGV